MRAISLDARLSAVARLVPPCECAADIGADHGFLGAHLLLTGRCARVRFVDISEHSLSKARRLVAKLKLEGRAEFLIGDGAEALSGPVDAAVMAGLGAEVIRGILQRGREKLAGAALVLSPNLGAPLLRRFLMESGYEIADEALAAREKELKSELFNLRFQSATGQLSNPQRINDCKKDIARVKTIIRERELKSVAE